MHKDLYFDSCGRGMIHVCRWEPEGTPKAVVQLVHGIAEHAQRYSAFAEFLTKNGYLVVAEDHMGHGGSITAPEQKGCFYGGWFSAVADTYRLLQDTKREFADVPYFLFGHSMGSFMARTILQEYPDSGISGCIICGTGWMPEIVLKTGLQVGKGVCKSSGADKPSPLLQKLMFGSYNKKIERPKSANDWLTRDERIVRAYDADPLCGFIPSAGLVRDMLTGMLHIQKKENLNKMCKALPVHFVAGGDDPVGDYGKGVRKAAAKFTECGMEQVSCRIYPLCRHEILNEINRHEIYEDLLNWLEEQS